MSVNNLNVCMDAKVFDKMTGSWICQLRKRAGYTQLEVATMIGTTYQHLSLAEAGNRSIGLRGLMNLRGPLNFTLSEFEAYIGNPNTEVVVATSDDVTDILHLDVPLSDKKLASAVQEQQVYVLKTPWAVVGVCCFSIFQQEPYLNAFYVDKDYRKQGCDKELIAFWENAMKEQGYDSVLVSTSGDDTCKYFYEKLGYQYVGFVQTRTRDSEELMYRKYLSE